MGEVLPQHPTTGNGATIAPTINKGATAAPYDRQECYSSTQTVHKPLTSRSLANFLLVLISRHAAMTDVML